LQISTTVPYADDARKATDRAIALEKAGLDIAWVAEAYGYDSPTLLGYIAARTERMRIGPAILPIFSRTPVLIAQTAAGLDAVSGGRAVLGLGASGPQVIEGWHGVPYDRPIGRMREVIGICRKTWRREVVTNNGIYQLPLPAGMGSGLGKPLKLITHPARERIPIFVAGLGTKSVELTAEIADGWMPVFFLPEMANAVWSDALAAGRSRRSPDLGPLEVCAGGAVEIGEDVTHLRDSARRHIALYIGGMGAKGKNFYNELVSKYGYADAAATVQDLYLAGEKEKAAAALPEELVEQLTLIGPEGYVRERITAHEEAGVTILNVTFAGPDPVRTLERLRAIVP
jgi:F420-dependent oxidoreductase-like protein